VPRSSAPSLLIAITALALLCGCAIGIDTEPPPDAASPTRAPTPTPTPSPLETPDTAADDQIAVALFTTHGDEPTNQSIIGPATMISGSRVTVTGECRGGALDYELRTAAAGEDPLVLLAATIGCDDGRSTNMLDGVNYSGPVQVAITQTDDVDEAWVQATQELVG